MSGKARVLVLSLVLGLIVISLILYSYHYREAENTLPRPITNNYSTTIINGTEYYEIPIPKGDGYLLYKDVLVFLLNPITTGCHGTFYLVLFPDLYNMTVSPDMVCTGTTSSGEKNFVVFSHNGYFFGVKIENNTGFFLVNKNYRDSWNVTVDRKGEWFGVLFFTNTGYLRYALVYTGSGFLAASKMLPPSPSKIIIRKDNTSKVILERGLCPWIRENNTYVYSGYIYSYNLSYLASKIGSLENYNITVLVNCVIDRIIYSENKIVPVEINLNLTFPIG